MKYLLCTWSLKQNFCYSLPRKKVRFSYGSLRISRIANFKNSSFLSGQEVVQINPNLVWSILLVGRIYDKRNFFYSLSSKKVSFSYGNLRLFQINNFKNRSF